MGIPNFIGRLVHIFYSPYRRDRAQDDRLIQELLPICQGTIHAAADLFDRITITDLDDLPLCDGSVRTHSNYDQT